MCIKNPDNGISTRGKDGQSDVFVYHPGDKHEHYWYDSKTGTMGGHGENASSEDKIWCGQRANDMKIGK